MGKEIPDEELLSLYEKKRKKEENDFVARLLKPYSTFLVKYPFVIILLLIVTIIFSGILSVLPATGAKDFPDFSDPTKGFEARGTTISSRGIAFVNTADVPRRQRGRRSVNNGLWNTNLREVKIDSDFVMVYEHSGGGNLIKHMKTICQMHKKKIESEAGYHTYFYTTHHLPNYIALLTNKTDCMSITQNDIDEFFSLLKNCVANYKNMKYKNCIKDEVKCASVTTSCRSHVNIPHKQDFATFVYNVFFFLTDTAFSNDVTTLSHVTSMDMYDFRSYDFFQTLYDRSLKDLDNAVYNDVKIVAFNMQGFKFHVFQTEVIVQSLFIISAIILVVLFIWFYSGSLFIGLMTLGCVLFATIISYFVYGRVFDMDFFPFLNMVTTIFIVGIGADDAFVYTGIWEEAKLVYVITNTAEHVEYLIKWTTHTLRHALLAMFVTSLTTAAAFYSNISSSVTSVKCFGLYSGTAIIVNYLLMVTFFPAVVIIHDKYLSKCMHACCPSTCKSRPQVKNQDRNYKHTASGNMQEISEREVELKTSKPFVTKLQAVLDIVSEKIFEKYLPGIIFKLRFVWIVILFCIGVGGIIVTFIEPGLSLPSTGEFQMFTSSNSLEQFELTYKRKFSFSASSSKGNQKLRFVFGVKPVDNGNKFNPDDLGTLEYDGPLDIANEQIWLRSFCTNIRNETFYISSHTCDIIEAFFTGLTSTCNSTCCNYTLPVPKDDFLTCLLRKKSLLTSAKFDDSNNLLSFILYVESSHRTTDAYGYNEELFNTMERWFDTQMSKTSFKGFWYMDQQFYDLQISLFKGTKESLAIAIAVAFVVILLTTLNVLLSIYSILTISFIISVTVGILVLSGWELNIMESVVFSVAAGLSADFTLHYSVAYKTSLLKNNRVERVKSAINHIGPAILMGAFTTFIAGLVMTPSSVLVYIQMAQFLMLVMMISWLFSTMFFLPLCAVIGPTGNFCQITMGKSSANQNETERVELKDAPPSKQNVSEIADVEGSSPLVQKTSEKINADRQHSSTEKLNAISNTDENAVPNKKRENVPKKSEIT
ncbi:protein dispatched homolog 1-like isoform X2 [Hydractinia symbiolongicarpus]|nr:protein dispatched homolog 1-like isoform X2 [Hydractinia symbiolongicarpus]